MQRPKTSRRVTTRQTRKCPAQLVHAFVLLDVQPSRVSTNTTYCLAGRLELTSQASCLEGWLLSEVFIDALKLGRSEPLAYVSVAQSVAIDYICVYAYHVTPNTIKKYIIRPSQGNTS
jgi:hypothetical protein